MTTDGKAWQRRLQRRRAGTSWQQIAKDERIPWGTFGRHLKQARTAGHVPPEAELPPIPHARKRGTPRVPETGSPSQISRQVPQGTSSAPAVAPPATIPVEAIADAVAAQVLARLQPLLEARVPEEVSLQVPEWVPGSGGLAPLPRYPLGTPGYPDKPHRDSRLNLHVPAGERWEVRAVAQGLKEEPSLLLHKLWRAFMTTTMAQEALQRYLTEMGTP
jgi:hypothetical protein